MKKSLLLFALIFTMLSCTPKMYSFSYVVDFSKYSKDGFFVTESNSVNIKYQAVGSVSSYLVSGVSSVKKKSKNSVNPVYKAMYNNYVFATSEDALNVLVEKCKSMGANGLINLQIKSFEVNKQLAFEASGMAIKSIE